MSADQLRRYVAAKAEWQAYKEWRAAGAAGDPPVTPNLDEINAEHEPGATKQTNNTRRIAMSKTPVTYTRNGATPRQDRPWTLGYVAYDCTKGIGGPDVKRISTADLVALLGDLGVADPKLPGWEVELPNGVRLGAIDPNSAAEPVIETPAVKPAKTTARKTTAKREVIPIPKGSTRIPAKRTRKSA